MHRTLIAQYRANRAELEQKILDLKRQHNEKRRWLNSLQEQAAVPESSIDAARLRLEVEDAEKAVVEIEQLLDQHNLELQQLRDRFLADIDELANGESTSTQRDQFTMNLLAEMNETMLDTRHRVLASEQRTEEIWARLSKRLDALELNHVPHLQEDVDHIQSLISFWTEATTLVGVLFMFVLFFGTAYVWALKEFRDGVWVPYELSIPATFVSLLVVVYIGHNLMAGHRRIVHS